MKLLSTEDYVDFECIGGECPISCCGGDWSILIDKGMADYYRSLEGKFGDRLREGIEDIDGSSVFKLNENRDCIFLNENKLCEIYRNLGEDKLCYTCKTYPRHFFNVGDILFCFLTNSCPEVTRMIFQKKEPLKTVLDDTDMPVEAAENLTGQKYDESSVDWEKFNHSIRAFVAGMHILQNRELVLKDRLVLLMFFVDRFQSIIIQKEDPSDLIAVFSEPDLYKMFLENEELADQKRDYVSKIHAFLMVFKNLLSRAYEHPMWKKCNELAEKIGSQEEYDIEAMTEAFDRFDTEEYQIEMEQLMTYRFFVAFMQGFENTDYFEKIVYEYVLYGALITYSALIEMEDGKESSQNDRILFYSLCSRADHTKKGKEALKDTIRADGFAKIETLLKLIS